MKSFRDIIDRYGLVDKYRNKLPINIVWTWTKRSSPALVMRSSYIDRILVKNLRLSTFSVYNLHGS